MNGCHICFLIVQNDQLDEIREIFKVGVQTFDIFNPHLFDRPMAWQTDGLSTELLLQPIHIKYIDFLNTKAYKVNCEI